MRLENSENTTTNFQSKIEHSLIDIKNPNKVNINTLLSNVRKKEEAKKKESLVFISLVGSVVVISGIIASF